MNPVSLLSVLVTAATLSGAPSPAPLAAFSLPRTLSVRDQLAAQRELQLARLHDYAIHPERFPLNTDDPSGPRLYFVDPKGRFCAVANLMVLSGRREDVLRIAATDNQVQVKNLSSGPVLDWIETSGLLREEVEQIQKPAPGYSYSEDRPSVAEAENRELTARLLGLETTLRAQSAASLDLAAGRLEARISLVD
jgi:hypothetical protein